MRHLAAALIALAVTVLPPSLARAQNGAQQTDFPAICEGRNLLEELPSAEIDKLRKAADSVPYARGNYWRATRDGQQILMVGTYHFPDARHDPLILDLASAMAEADRLLVEAGPEEQQRLADHLARNPEATVLMEGPTLRERMDDAEWAELTDAMSDRGIPGFAVAKMQPWFVAMMLGVSPCLLGQLQDAGIENGLDQRIVALADGAAVPVEALEPWDTVFTLFGGMTPEEEIDMIRASIPAAKLADDYAVTMTDAYFAGEPRLIWEFTRQQMTEGSGLDPDAVDRQLAEAEEELMFRRNETWVPVLVRAAGTAAAERKPVIAAFGALHLSGKRGVLKLLEDRGYTIERWDPADGPISEKGKRNGD